MNSPKDVKELTDALNLIKIGKHRCKTALWKDFEAQKKVVKELTEKALEHIAGHEVKALESDWMYLQVADWKRQNKELTQLPPMKNLVQEDYRLARYNQREKDWKVLAKGKDWRDLAKKKYWKDSAKEKGNPIEKDWKEKAEEQVLIARNNPRATNWKEKEKQTMVRIKKQMDGWIAEAQDIVQKEKTLHLRISTLQGKTLMGDIKRSREGIADAKYITRAAADRLGNSKGMLNNRIRELQAEKYRYAVKRVELLGRLQYESEKALLHSPHF